MGNLQTGLCPDLRPSSDSVINIVLACPDHFQLYIVELFNSMPPIPPLSTRLEGSFTALTITTVCHQIVLCLIQTQMPMLNPILVQVTRQD